MQSDIRSWVEPERKYLLYCLPFGITEKCQHVFRNPESLEIPQAACHPQDLFWWSGSRVCFYKGLFIYSSARPSRLLLLWVSDEDCL